MGDLLIALRRRYFAKMTVFGWVENCHVKMGSARTDQNITSVNEYAKLDGVVHFFLFEFTKLLTLFKEH